MAGVIGVTRGEIAIPRTCEVLVRGVWMPLTSDEAMALRPERLKRCPDCWGKLRPPRGEGPRAALEHDRPHKGCPRDASFAGCPGRHPKALF